MDIRPWGSDMLARKLALLIPLALALAACAVATSPPETDTPAAVDPFRDFEPVEATTVLPAPAPLANSIYDAEAAAHGQYLVELLGCGACHTDGALIGEPRSDRMLAGSRIGIAHSNPLRVKNPGVVFPANLTPDPETGIGAMPDDALGRAIRGGVNRHGNRALKVMPVAAYARITEEDVNAIVAYLRSLEPVSHRVPEAVPEGSVASELFVHFGVYRNRAR